MVIAKTERGLKHFKELFQQKAEATTIEEKEAIPLQKYYRARCEVRAEGEVFLKEVKKS
jgi:hypothetical protein